MFRFYVGGNLARSRYGGLIAVIIFKCGRLEKILCFGLVFGF
jgi:hypothetical protein